MQFPPRSAGPASYCLLVVPLSFAGGLFENTCVFGMLLVPARERARKAQEREVPAALAAFPGVSMAGRAYGEGKSQRVETCSPKWPLTEMSPLAQFSAGAFSRNQVHR